MYNHVLGDKELFWLGTFIWESFFLVSTKLESQDIVLEQKPAPAPKTCTFNPVCVPLIK